MNERDRLWYSYDPDAGIELHDTAMGAEKVAQSDMEYYSDCAETDFWHEDIAALSWGELTPYAQACCVEERQPTDEYPDGWQRWALVSQHQDNPWSGPYELHDGPETVWVIDPPSDKVQTRYGSREAALAARNARGSNDGIRLLAVSLSECVARIHDCARLISVACPDADEWCRLDGLGDQVDAALLHAEALLALDLDAVAGLARRVIEEETK